MFILLYLLCMFDFLGIGDWGLGIGDWAQSPIPNPQSPYKLHTINITYINNT